MRKYLAAILSACIVLSVLTGCGSHSTEQSSSPVRMMVTQETESSMPTETEPPETTEAVTETPAIETRTEQPTEMVEETTEAPETVAALTLAEIPDYSDSPYTEINGNAPNFTQADLLAEDFEEYSALDSLGRCGIAYAMISRESMPQEERGPIGDVKPSGWQTVKYNGVVEGNYLYNRCHLIGYQLAGENANENNLITGTRYFNVEGMASFENRVADYVEHTGNHVLYRVTPMYDGDNLVASGVQLEAESVEDAGAGLSFNVFVYNIQPGIRINYATGASELDGTIVPETEKETEKVTEAPTKEESKALVIQETEAEEDEADSSSPDYIANRNTKKFHYPYCSSVDQMKEKNKYEYSGSRDGLISQGYKPCKRCNP